MNNALLELQLINWISSGERTQAQILLDIINTVPLEGFDEMKKLIVQVGIHLWGLETGIDFEDVPLYVSGRTIDDNFVGLIGQFIAASASVYRVVYNQPEAFLVFSQLSFLFWDAVDRCQQIIDQSRVCRVAAQTAGKA